jgi:E3 ubiquitin-protein ligase HUWE1
VSLASEKVVLTIVFITQEEASQSAIFLYETSLVNQLASLMVPGQGVGDAVLSAAVYAIDACAHHRNKLLEVSAAIGTNVTHGTLISLFRDTVRRLTGGGEPGKAEHVMYEVMDALLGLIAFVATSPPHSNHIISAGIIPIVLDVPKTLADRRDNVRVQAESPADMQYIARSLGLVDALVFSTQQGLTAFSNADGVTTLVNAVKVSTMLLEKADVAVGD